MSKYKAFTVSQVPSLIKEGRGQGHGPDYSPWITVRDVPSRGKSSRENGWTTGRSHHLLSSGELFFFYILDWSSKVKDIREQYPLLPIAETMAIAERLGIRHPIDNKTGESIVMTTDFLIDVEVNGNIELIARSVKEKPEDLATNRTIEKLEIERTYWKERGIDWGMIIKSDISLAMVKNIEWIHSSLELDESVGIPPELILQIEHSLFEAVNSPGLSLSHAALSVDNKLGLKVGASLGLVKHLIAKRYWKVDMANFINPSNELVVERSPLIKNYKGMSA